MDQVLYHLWMPDMPPPKGIPPKIISPKIISGQKFSASSPPTLPTGPASGLGRSLGDQRSDNLQVISVAGYAQERIGLYYLYEHYAYLHRVSVSLQYNRTQGKIA